MQYPDLGDTVYLRFSTRNSSGDLTAVSTQGTPVLVVNGVAQSGTTPPITGSGGIYYVGVDTSNNALKTASAAWAVGDHIRATISGIAVGGSGSYGGHIDDEATIGPLATQASVDTIDDFLDTEIAAIKAKTDLIPASPAAVGSAMTLADDAITAAKIATGAFEAAKFAADFFTSIITAVWTTAGTRILTAFSFEVTPTAASKTGYALSAAGVTAVQSGLATSAEVTSIQNNTRVVRVVPDQVQRPESGTTDYRIELLLYDATGNMEAPDSAPTIELSDEAGTDRSSMLDATTMTLVSTGRYRSVWTVADDSDLEQLVFTFTVVEGGETRLYSNGTQVVAAIVASFTETDRNRLIAIEEDTGTTLPATLTTISGKVDTVDGVADAIKLKTDLIPAVPASQGDVTSATSTITAAITTAESNIRGGSDTLSGLSDQLDGVATSAGSAATAAGSAQTAAEAAQASAATASTEATAAKTAAQAVKVVTDKVATGLEETSVGSGVWQATESFLENAPSGSGLALSDSVPDPGTSGTVGEAFRKVLDYIPASGNGPRAVTITVRDQANATVQGVRVVLDNGTREFSGTSNASGIVSLSLYDEPYEAAGAKDGYTHVPQTFTVSSGSTAFTLNVSEVSITIPGDPDLCTGYFVAVDPEGAPESGATFYAKLVEGDGTEGYSLDTTEQSATSAANGLVEFTLMRGKRYVVRRGTSYSQSKPFTVPDAATYAIPEFLGTP